MSERDPRINPVVGDVLSIGVSNGWNRIRLNVLEVTADRVKYAVTDDVSVGVDEYDESLEEWRAQAANAAVYLYGKEPDPNDPVDSFGATTA